MANDASVFVWYELMTPNASKAKEFYCKIIGWNTQDSGVPGMDYTLFGVGDQLVAGVMDMSSIPEQECSGQPGWLGYIGVGDVDAKTAEVEAAGGSVLRPGDDIPNIGRFAIVADPQGAVFALFQPLAGSEPPENCGGAEFGIPGWHELYAKDGDTAFDFYKKLFGWKITQSLDMGAMGQYRIFSANDPKSPDTNIGGLMTSPAGMPPHWGFYFKVKDFDDAVERVKSHGGTVTNGPMQVPGGSWIANCQDPQGVHFSLSSGG